jgi:hypothetical protein
VKDLLRGVSKVDDTFLKGLIPADELDSSARE